MKTRLLNPQAARQLIAGLLFLLMIAPLMAQVNNDVDKWNDKDIALKISTRAEGAQGDPIIISSAAELAYLAQQVNNGGNLQLDGNLIKNAEPTSAFKGIYFALDIDIDLQGNEWTPIGTSGNPFGGNFDGRGHCVSGLKVHVDQSELSVYAGLFGYVMNNTIQNLGVKVHVDGIEATGEQCYAGGIAGSAEIIRNCYVEGPGTIKGKGMQMSVVGGISGNCSSISHCYATVNVQANQENNNCIAGGISGIINKSVTYTYATGNVVASGTNAYAGGICGQGNYADVNHNLALNKIINGTNDISHRIVGFRNGYPSEYINYASPNTIVINSDDYSDNSDNLHGSDDIDANDYADKLINTGSDWGNAWNITQPYLPKLKMVDGYDSPSYVTWPYNNQPHQPVVESLPNAFTLRIDPPTGGTLIVKDKIGKEHRNGALLPFDTELTLSHEANEEYEFVRYLSRKEKNGINTPCVSPTTMPKSNLWLTAEFKEKDKPEPEPEPEYPPYVPVYYTVTLPEVEGATTDPEAGSYEVESWNTFRFYLTLDSAYSESVPLVSTSRGETLVPRQSDGAYLVKYVRTDVDISIDSIRPNPAPVANETIRPSMAKVWTSHKGLHMLSPIATEAHIYSPSGQQQATCPLPAGHTETLSLPAGIYFVRIGRERFKVGL